jgi:prolyl-tRNA synthetase
MTSAARGCPPVLVFSHALVGKGFSVPGGHTARPTSDLLTNGLVAELPYRGIPVYGPIGTAVLHTIEDMLQTALGCRGYAQVEIPSLMRTEDLEDGEPIGPQFASKIIATNDALKGYHLLTTPEMLFVRGAGQHLLSHRSLPVRRSYTANFFRNMATTRSLIVCRQFRIVGTVALERHESGVRNALDEAVAASAEVLAALGVPTHAIRQEWLHKVELLFPSDEGDTWVDSAGNGAAAKVKELSLAIGYQYAAGSPLPLRYRSETNRNAPVLMATYGLCSNRLLHSVFEASKDEHGFALPAAVRPFDAVVVAQNDRARGKARRLSERLSRAGLRVGLDDRTTMSVNDRQRFAEYAGAAAVAVVAAGTPGTRIRPRAITSEQAALPAGEAIEYVAKLARGPSPSLS